MNTRITDPKAWMESKRANGWTISETIRSWEPNPYGAGEIHLTELHMNDGDGNFAGVLTRETFRNKAGKVTVRFHWLAFTCNTNELYEFLGGESD